MRKSGWEKQQERGKKERDNTLSVSANECKDEHSSCPFETSQDLAHGRLLRDFSCDQLQPNPHPISALDEFTACTLYRQQPVPCFERLWGAVIISNHVCSSFQVEAAVFANKEAQLMLR